LGIDFLKANKSNVMISKGYITIHGKKIPCFSLSDEYKNQCCRISVCEDFDYHSNFHNFSLTTLSNGQGFPLYGHVRPETLYLLFLLSVPQRLNEHTIDTGSARTIKQRPYRIHLSKREQAEQEIKEMTENKIIEPSYGPWCSPIVMVAKKDGSVRLL
jgi:hypothetical protein